MKMQGERNDPVPGDNRGAVRTNDPSRSPVDEASIPQRTLAPWPGAMGSGDSRNRFPRES